MKTENVDMADIASDLADKIIALINSKPRSPTKDELVGLINASGLPHAGDRTVRSFGDVGVVYFGLDPAQEGSDRSVTTFPAFNAQQAAARAAPLGTQYAEFNAAQAAGRAARAPFKVGDVVVEIWPLDACPVTKTVRSAHDGLLVLDWFRDSNVWEGWFSVMNCRLATDAELKAQRRLPDPTP